MCVCVVGSLFDPVQSATQNLPCPQICPPIPSYNILPKPSNSAELSAPRIQWVSGWRDRATEEDGTDSEDTYEDSNEGMDGTERWMEKLWGSRNEYTLSEDENDTDGETKRSSATVGMRTEDGDSDEEVESDLGSLRELGSEGEWEPFHRLQILCGSEWQHSEDEWSETEEECAPSVETSESNLKYLLQCDFKGSGPFLLMVLGPL